MAQAGRLPAAGTPRAGPGAAGRLCNRTADAGAVRGRRSERPDDKADERVGQREWEKPTWRQSLTAQVHVCTDSVYYMGEKTDFRYL
jgi:hypothetical protein